MIVQGARFFIQVLSNKIINHGKSVIFVFTYDLSF